MYLDGIDIVSDDDEFRLLLLDEGGDVVQAKLNNVGLLAGAGALILALCVAGVCIIPDSRIKTTNAHGIGTVETNVEKGTRTGNGRQALNDTASCTVTNNTIPSYKHANTHTPWPQQEQQASPSSPAWSRGGTCSRA